MTDSEGTPRVMRLTFEFHVPAALRRNIHGSKVNTALDTLAGRVVGLAENLFPWADKVTVRKEWLYNWIDEQEEIQMPATDANTPPK